MRLMRLTPILQKFLVQLSENVSKIIINQYEFLSFLQKCHQLLLVVKMKDIANPIFDENLRNQRNQPIFDKNILKTTMLNVIKKQIKEQAFINQRIRLQRKIQCLQMFADYRLCFNVYYDQLLTCPDSRKMKRKEM